MMSIPSEMKGRVADIAAGRTYGVGLDTDGHLHTWGYTKITDKIDIANIPDEVQQADLVMFAGGDDHVVALDDKGQLYVWGNTRLQQGNFTNDMKKAMKAGGEDWDRVQLEASYQFSAVVSSNGML
jgi:peptide/nickel transport system permease protein